MKQFLKRLGKWIADHVVQLLGWLALLLIAGFAVRRGMLWFARRGRVDEPKNFVPVPGDPTKILLHDTASRQWRKVSLPPGVTSDQVRAAGYSTGVDPAVHVEVAHETVDRRRYIDPRSDSD
jgi:hypothetical protein